MAPEMLKWLGLRFSKLLSYSYAGFLLIVVAGVLNPGALSGFRGAASWELTALAAVVVGAGVHAFHRTLLVPVHHFLSSLLWHLFELGRPKAETLIPTRWLGTLTPPVTFFWQIPAYSTLRHSKPFEGLEDRWDLIHAEHGLMLLTGEALGSAALVVKFVPKIVVAPLISLTAGPLAIGAIALVIATTLAAYFQHRNECLTFRAKQSDVVAVLRETGFIA